MFVASSIISRRVCVFSVLYHGWGCFSDLDFLISLLGGGDYRSKKTAEKIIGRMSYSTQYGMASNSMLNVDQYGVKKVLMCSKAVDRSFSSRISRH